jgi:hypothetical protein
MHKTNQVGNFIALAATWFTAIISRMTKEDVTFFLAALVSIASLVYAVVGTREKIMKIRRMKKGDYENE